MWKVAIIILKRKYIIKYSSHCFIVICIVSIPAGLLFGWLDFVWVLLFGKLFLQ